MPTPSLQLAFSHPATPAVSGAETGGELLWLCCHLPRLPLEASGLPQDRPAAVLDKIKGRTCVISASPAAEALGVRAGMPLAAAYALCAGLETFMRDPRQEAESLQKLAEACLQFTSWISLEGADALLLEVGGSLKLFGGLESLEASIAGTIADLGHDCRIAVAPVPFAARLLASQGACCHVLEREALRSRLGTLPVTALGLDPKIVSRLEKAGLVRLRDLWRLPREGLARRYGTSLLATLDRAQGTRPDVKRHFHLPPKFAESLELSAEATSVAHYFPCVEKLVERLTAFLVARDAAVSELRLVLTHACHAATEIGLALKEACRSREHFLALLKEKLERSSLPAPVRELTLLADRIEPRRASTLDLFEQSEAADEEWRRLIDGLEVRLGRAALRRFSVLADHRPEAAMLFSPELAGQQVGSGTRKQPVEGPIPAPAALRPLWLLSKPRSSAMDLKLLSGTERIESGWWEGRPVRRDYRWAVDRDGVRWWVYRDLRQPDRWLLHGLYG